MGNNFASGLFARQPTRLMHLVHECGYLFKDRLYLDRIGYFELKHWVVQVYIRRNITRHNARTVDGYPHGMAEFVKDH